MTKITPAVALGMSIADLGKEFGWARPTRTNMIGICERNVSLLKLCQNCTDSDQCWSTVKGDSTLSVGEQEHKRFDCLEKRILLKDLLWTLELMYSHLEAVNGRYWRQYRSIFQKIIPIGLTRLDCVALPQSTITLEDLKKLPRKKLLSLDARLLGTISEITAAKYSVYHDNHLKAHRLSPATIADVLKGKASKIFIMNKHTENKTREVLVQLGFAYEDGSFMQPLDNRRALVDDLIANDHFDWDTAETIAEIAKRRGWVKF